MLAYLAIYFMRSNYLRSHRTETVTIDLIRRRMDKDIMQHKKRIEFHSFKIHSCKIVNKKITKLSYSIVQKFVYFGNYRNMYVYIYKITHYTIFSYIKMIVHYSFQIANSSKESFIYLFSEIVYSNLNLPCPKNIILPIK